RLCRDWFSLQSRLKQLLHIDHSQAPASLDRQFKFHDFGLNKVDCIHLFNSINYSHKPWVLTFETLVPRFQSVLAERESNPAQVKKDPKIINALRAMSEANCLALLPISRSAGQIQEAFLSLFPEFKPSLMKKTQVLHPPQVLLEDNPESFEYPCENSNTVSFLMVGHHFFRKGGCEILDVLSQIRSELSVDIKLCIISKITDDGYATDISDSDRRDVLGFIAKNSDWIDHYPVLQPKEVEKKMLACDIGLLPSYAETYGYSVLEFQAAGRPVITTNVRAFPEINNNECGWIIPVGKREVGGESFFRTQDERSALSDAIRSGLYVAVREVIEKPELVRDKGSNAWKRIKLFLDDSFVEPPNKSSLKSPQP
ncbi:MAG: glycosyltransferase family 4 protein, partial [Imperialibacter sp.]